MMCVVDEQKDAGVIRGEFYTDGKTYIFRLTDVPISGTGATAQEAFVNLIAARSLAGALPERIERLAREQRGEKVRVSIIRTTLAGLIILGTISGALVTAAGMAPKVSRDLAGGVTETMTGIASRWLDGLTPAQEEKLVRVVRQFRTLMMEPEVDPQVHEALQPRVPR